MPSDSENLHWAAGFLDGEGTFRCGKDFRLELSAPQNYRQSLDKLVQIFGGVVYRRDQSRIPNKHPEIFIWYLHGNEKAKAAMEKLSPLLSPYRQGQIYLALDRYATRPLRGQKRRQDTTHCRHGHLYTPETTYMKPNGGRNCKPCRATAVSNMSRRKREEHYAERVG